MDHEDVDALTLGQAFPSVGCTVYWDPSQVEKVITVNPSQTLQTNKIN